MPKITPDTSGAVPWRVSRHRDYPIKAYRVWGIDLHHDGKWILESAAMSNVKWEGPVIRADVKPYDSKLFDKARAVRKNESRRIYSNKQWIELNGVIRPIEDEEAFKSEELASHSYSTGGIHAVKTIEVVRETAEDYMVPVYGEVKLWGRVAVFRRGYRAELCMITRLWYVDRFSFSYGCGADNPHNEPGDIKKCIDDLSARYDCEVTCE